ncbi:hypothetical protein AAC387_Pa01g1540 [Persea americana]
METREQAVENCASWRSLDPDSIDLASSSKAFATTERGVPSSLLLKDDCCLCSCCCCCCCNATAFRSSFFALSLFLKDLVCI